MCFSLLGYNAVSVCNLLLNFAWDFAPSVLRKVEEDNMCIFPRSGIRKPKFSINTTSYSRRTQSSAATLWNFKWRITELYSAGGNDLSFYFSSSSLPSFSSSNNMFYFCCPYMQFLVPTQRLLALCPTLLLYIIFAYPQFISALLLLLPSPFNP